jgi:hypothetical protein
VASGEETWERARQACLRAYSACADHCEGMLASDRLDTTARADLIVCAAVCRVAHRALHEGIAVAHTLVEYSVEVCNRTAGGVGGSAAAAACESAAAAAAELLLVS